MKIGDKVRFLDAVGGGKVTGFQGRDIVLVEDEDGFDIPVLASNCVVVDADQEKRMSGETPINLGKKQKPAPEPSEPEPADKPVAYKPMVQERKGGDKLNIFLCFEPHEVKELKKTEFDLYFVNDSNYALNYAMLCGENAIWMLHHTDTAEPNTKIFIETLQTEQLNDLQHICLQMIAFKPEKTFMLKQPINAEVRLNLTRFYKLHLFQPNEFFNTPVLTIPIMENDLLVCDPKKALADLTATGMSQAEPPTPTPHIQIKKNKDDDEIVDLHADQLLDTTTGMTPNDILEYQLDVFKKKMTEFAKVKGKRAVFIHGKGEGVLRSKIITELKRNYPRCNWQDASFREYGFGATLVIVH